MWENPSIVGKSPSISGRNERLRQVGFHPIDEWKQAAQVIAAYEPRLEIESLTRGDWIQQPCTTERQSVNPEDE